MSFTSDTPDEVRPGPVRLRVALRAGQAWLARTLDAETERLAPWGIVALGAGIALYFALTVEPPLWLGASAAAGALAGLVTLPRPWRVARLLAAAGLAAALGFFLATVRTAALESAPLTRPLGPARIEGILMDLDGTAKGGTRLLIEVRAISGLSPDATPRRVRVNFAKPLADGQVAPGDRIAVTGVYLLPPPPPAAPGAYDFARRAYFDGVGAVGSVRRGDATRVGLPDPAWSHRLNGAVWRFRHTLAQHIAAAIPDPAAAGVGIALVTGLRSAIPQEADDALRGAGLTHTLSISGLHLGLIAFGLFAAVRFTIALVEPLALRINSKKWAAGAALAGVAIYFGLTGMSIPAQRSFVMLALVLAAMIADRRAFTLRNVAIAAGIILMLFPEGLLDAGFQMSFAAVVALVSAHELWERRRARVPRDLSWHGRIGSYLGATTISSLAASAATAPFGLYHFQVVQDYGVLGNLVALPLLGTVVMPAVAASYFLLPFGLADWAYAVMGWGLELMLAVARVIAALPGAVYVLPAAPASAFLAVVLGGLWLTLWGTSWRRWGLVPIALGGLAWATAARPDLLVSGDGKHLAARAETGALVTLLGRPSSFQSSVWLRRDGEDPDRDEAPETRTAARANLACDEIGCILPMRGGVRLAVSKSPASLDDDCPEADIVVALEPARGACAGPRLVIDRFDLWRNGAHAVWVTEKKLRVQTVRDWRGVRPWAPDPARARKPDALSTAASGPRAGPAP